MPRCANCGKANRDGALYCQDCGQRIDGSPGSVQAAAGPPQSPAPAQPAAPAAIPVAAMAAPGGQGGGQGGPQRPRPADGPQCPSCGTVNPVGMNFCKMCGTAMPSASRAASGAAPGRTTCGQCGKQTPSGYSFCQHCGHRLGPVDVPPTQVAGVINRGRPEPLSLDKHMPPMPTPPAGVRAQGPGPLLQPQPASAQRPIPIGQMGGGSPMIGQTTGQAASGQAIPGGGAPYYGSPAGQGVASTVAVHGGGQSLVGRLITIRRDGSDGDVIPLTGETFDIGRTEGSLCFAEDPFLGPRHVRFLVYGGVVRIRPLDTVNGVFLRLRDPHDLQPGDVFYIGKELVRFENLTAEERDPPSLVEHGVRLFGSAPRESWGRLRQLTCAGTTRDLWYLSRAEIVLGREEGDITFPDDEFMSRRHAVLSRVGNRARLVDQNSSNGTYLRLRGDRELRPSDVLRMGDQLLRFEP